METEKLIEIKKNLALMPTLQDRIKKLKGKISDAEETVNGLREKYESEALDVEKLERNSLSTIILRNFGRYEVKFDKESEEMLSAKLVFDKAVERVNDLNKELKLSEERLFLLIQEKRTYEVELNRREKLIKSDDGSEVSKRYGVLEADQDELAKQLAETEEALRAAERVISTADTAMDHLDKAEGWATFDVWTRGGIFSHIAKYEHIDNAKYCFNQLNSQLEDLQEELEDLNLIGISSLDGIDSTTRTIDFWFDNIFTDMNVRQRIREDNEGVSDLRNKICGLTEKLKNDMTVIKSRISELEQKKNDLIMGGV